MNAVRHGLTAGRHALALDESAGEYDEFKRGLRRDLAPEGSLEEHFFSEVVDCAWRLRRAVRIEAHLFSLARARDRSERAGSEKRAQERNIGGVEAHLEPLLGTVTVVDRDAHTEAADRLHQAELEIASQELADGRMFERGMGDELLKLGRYERGLYSRMRNALADLEAAQSRRLAKEANLRSLCSDVGANELG